MNKYISLTEYAAKNNIPARSARRKAENGDYITAMLIGNHWIIDESEINRDRRIKTGKYKKRG